MGPIPGSWNGSNPEMQVIIPTVLLNAPVEQALFLWLPALASLKWVGLNYFFISFYDLLILWSFK